tara:strand:+ start:261 stop:791 length:531 start_codon:yes stop_codon:yes gene_type:complete
MSFDFKIIESNKISGLKQILLSSFTDHRGALFSFFDKDITNRILPNDLNFEHVKFANNNAGTLRGIHGDFKSWKLVMLISGNIEQVAVDNRKDSPTYKAVDNVLLNADQEPRALLLPPGVGNGFLSITKSVYCYALAYGGDYSDFDDQFSLKWNDSDLKIPWESKIHNPIISDRDR